jgi:uncharacterized membrane protein YbhN (UPF0104 family)
MILFLLIYFSIGLELALISNDDSPLTCIFLWPVLLIVEAIKQFIIKIRRND